MNYIIMQTFQEGIKECYKVKLISKLFVFLNLPYILKVKGLHLCKWIWLKLIQSSRYESIILSRRRLIVPKFALLLHRTPNIEHINSLVTLLGTPCQSWVEPPFAFRRVIILCGINSSCQKHSLEMLIHIDLIASQIATDQSAELNLLFHQISKVLDGTEMTGGFWSSVN